MWEMEASWLYFWSNVETGLLELNIKEQLEMWSGPFLSYLHSTPYRQGVYQSNGVHWFVEGSRTCSDWGFSLQGRFYWNSTCGPSKAPYCMSMCSRTSLYVSMVNGTGQGEMLENYDAPTVHLVTSDARDQANIGSDHYSDLKYVTYWDQLGHMAVSW